MKLDEKDIMPADYQGWNWDSEVFEQFVNETQANTVIECGTWKGMSTMKLHKALQKLNKPFQLVCVDTWLGGIEHMDDMAWKGLMPKKYGYPQLYFQFLSNMHHAGCLENLLPVPNSTINGARWLKNKKMMAELIYIDASHESPDVYYDIKEYWDLLLPKGILFGDDYYYAPVSSCLNRFCKENNLQFEVLKNFWVLRKS